MAGDISLTAGTNSAGGTGGNVTIVSGNSTATNAGNVTISLGNGLAAANNGEFRIRNTVGDQEFFSVSENVGLSLQQGASLVPGASATIGTTTGSFVIGAASSTFVLTNNKITNGSLVFATVQTATLVSLLSVVVDSVFNTATFTFSGVVGLNTTVGFMVVNPTQL